MKDYVISNRPFNNLTGNMPNRSNQIFLCSNMNSKENISSSRSKSRLRHSFSANIFSYKDSINRISPLQYAAKNEPRLKATNMEDPQIRIERTHSPLYQNSSN